VRTQRETDLEDEVKRLTTEASCAAHNAAEYHDIIRGQRERIAELEAEVKALWLEKIERDNVADSEVEEWKDSCDPGVDKPEQGSLLGFFSGRL